MDLRHRVALITGASSGIGRAGTAEEIAEVIVFLASDAASFMTGETVEVNGGQWMD